MSTFSNNPLRSLNRRSVLAAGQSEVFDVPAGVFPLTVAVSPNGAGTGYVEFTASPKTLIDAGTALWFAWPAAAVSSATVDSIQVPCTAVRFVCTAGNVFGEVTS